MFAKTPWARTALATTLVVVSTLLAAAPGARAQTGYKSLFIGHSFFVPFANGMPFHATQAGITGHEQTVFFSGGASGSPQRLWEVAWKRAEIQAVLDGGDIELFGMTYHPDYPSLEGYENWISYALAQNPDTRIMLALPWSPNPGSTTATDYADTWLAGHATEWHPLYIDYLRGLYPGAEIFCNPYGQSAVELRLLFEAGNLPDVSRLVGDADDAIYTDIGGHAGDILIELGQLVWLNAIYDVDLTTYAYDPGYVTDLKGIAQSIMDAHLLPPPACDDRFDNDGDGLIDYPNDPECTDALDLSEELDCRDGIDNDGDGDIDHPSDSGCTDYRDESEHPQCSDGIENEWDGLIDYPNDPDCASPSGVTESPPYQIVCGLGAELALLLPPLMWLWRRRA